MVNKTIAFAANSDLGFDQRMQRICGSLHGEGFCVFILGRLFSHSAPLEPVPYGRHRLRLRFQKGKLAYAELNLRIFLYFLNKDFDAICSVDLDTLPACWLLSVIKGKKLAHDAHEYMEEVPEVFDRPFTKWMWNRVAHAFLPSVGLAYTVSRGLQEEFFARYGKSFHLVRNMAEAKKSLSAPDTGHEESGFWVYLGAVNTGRGLEEFLEVLPATNRRLVVLGEGDKLPEIKKMVANQGIEHLVEFRGRVNPEAAHVIMQRAWAGINLLRDEGLSYRHSLANKFFDYVHAGIPQICISFPEYRAMMKEFEVGILTALKKESILAATELISMPENQAFLRAEAAKAREVWNWESESATLCQLWHRFLES